MSRAGLARVDGRLWDGALLVGALEALAGLDPGSAEETAVLLRGLALAAAGLSLVWPRVGASASPGSEARAPRLARPAAALARLAVVAGSAAALGLPWASAPIPVQALQPFVAAAALAIGCARVADAPARGRPAVGLGALLGALAATRLSPEPVFAAEVAAALGWAVALLIVASLGLAVGGRQAWLERAGAGFARVLRCLPSWAPGAALAALSAALVGTFAARAWGAVLFGNDHSSFLYNLHVLRAGFPRMLNYTPWWNAGVVEWEPVRSGSLVALGLLAPFMPWLSIEQLYGALVPVLAWGLTPAAVAVGARVLGMPPPGAAAAGLIALIPNADLLEWIYRHGVPPFLLSAALVPLTTALLYRVALRGDAGRWAFPALLAAVSLGMFWMLFGLMVLPAALLALLWPGVPAGRRLKVLAILAAGAVIHLPWIAGFFTVYDAEHLATWPAALRWAGVLEELHAGLRRGEPNTVLLVAAVLGARHLGRRAAGPFVLGGGLLLLGLTLLARGGVDEWAMLQFDRFVIPAGYVLALPAGAWVEGLVRGGLARSRRLRPAPGYVIAVAVVLLLHVSSALAEYTRVKIRSLPPPVERLAERLRALTPPSGRILFAGRWGGHPLPLGGQLAYVQILTERAMVADYYHYRAGPTPEGRIPPEYAASPEAFDRYLRLYNVELVVARVAEAHWLALVRGLPEPRPREESFGRLQLFQTGRADGLALDGCSHVEVALNRIRVRPCGPADVVLKLHWVEGLEVDGPSSIEPYPMEPGLPFILVRPRGAHRVEIRYDGPSWLAWLRQRLRSPPWLALSTGAVGPVGDRPDVRAR